MTVNTYAFDAYGTLFDVHSAIVKYGSSIGDKAAIISNLWRVKQLEYSWTLSDMGRYEDFWSLTAKALDYALATHGIQDGALRERILSAYEDIEVFPDVSETLSTLSEAGHKVFVFTNANHAMIETALDCNGMTGDVDGVISVEDVKIYKPQPSVYAHLVKATSSEKEEVVLISSNRWDIAGGSSAGLKTVWCNRAGVPDEYANLAPTAVVSKLTDVPSLTL